MSKLALPWEVERTEAGKYSIITSGYVDMSLGCLKNERSSRTLHKEKERLYCSHYAKKYFLLASKKRNNRPGFVRHDETFYPDQESISRGAGEKKQQKKQQPMKNKMLHGILISNCKHILYGDVEER